jgi:hypothetical protein
MKLKDALIDIKASEEISIYFMDDDVDYLNYDKQFIKKADLTKYFKDAILGYVVYAVVPQKLGWTDVYLVGTSKDLTR